MWMNGLFLPEFMFITHFHLVILDLRLDWSFSQRRSWVIVSWELFFGFPIPDCYYLSLQKKKHTPFMTFFLVCKRRQGRNEMWGHLIPSFPFTSLSLSGFHSLLFSYNFAFPKVRTIMAYGVAAHFWGFGQRWTARFTHYPDIDSISGVIRSSCLIFSKINLTPFSSTLFILRLQSLSRH